MGLRWLDGKPEIMVETDVSHRAMVKICKSIEDPSIAAASVSCDSRLALKSLENKSTSSFEIDEKQDEGGAHILPDCSNMEAVATAYILKLLLAPRLAQTIELVPRVIEESKDIPRSIHTIMILC